jgi:phosphoheptose isomerase
MHVEWTCKYDGKFCPVTGDPGVDERSYKQVNAHTMEATSKKGGKVVSTTRIVVSADGKSRTVTSSGTNAKGQKVTTVAVYDKE